MSSNPSYRPCEIIEPTYGKMLITVMSIVNFFGVQFKTKQACQHMIAWLCLPDAEPVYLFFFNHIYLVGRLLWHQVDTMGTVLGAVYWLRVKNP